MGSNPNPAVILCAHCGAAISMTWEDTEEWQVSEKAYLNNPDEFVYVQRKWTKEEIEKECICRRPERLRQEIKNLQLSIQELKEEINLQSAELNETRTVRDAYAAKIIRFSVRMQELKDEIIRLHQQQVDVDWEIEGDKLELSAEDREHIASMADRVIEKVGEDERLMKELKSENKKLRTFIKELDRSLYLGPDLQDSEILRYYIEVISVIKEEAKQLLKK